MSRSIDRSELSRFEYHQLSMGVDTKLVVYAESESHARSACRAAFERLNDLEDVMSDYRSTSELLRLCSHAGGAPVPISDDLFRVLAQGQRIAAESDGAFDMTVGPLVQLWRVARKSHVMPRPDELARARAVVGYQKLKLDPARHTAQLTTPGMRLDLGGIGKGFAGDEAIKTLAANGITSALFQAGGDIVLSNPPPDQAGWIIDLPHPPGATPLSSSPTPPLHSLPESDESTVTLSNCAISTSGDSNQFLDIGGKRYSHLIDPHTGIGLTSRKLVTVIAPNGLTSDPLSKAASILAPAQLQVLLQHHPHTTVYARTVPLGE